MGLLSNILARSPLVQETGAGFYSGGSIFGGNKTTISPQTAMYLTTVFACTRVIAETISSISIDVYEYEGDGKKKSKDHPLYNLLKYSPNSNITSVMWREMMAIALNTRGNHYTQIIRNHNRVITSFYPLRTDSMTVQQTKSGKLVYTYDTGSKKIQLPQSEILHIRGLPGDDGFTGLSPIEYNKKSIQLGATTQEFGINFFDKGANASGAFSTDSELSDEAYNRLKDGIKENYAGMQNSGKPMLLEGGLKFERISIPNNDAQFLETRKYQKEEIASIFRVPMHMINSLENATFSNIEHQSLEFVKFTIMPWVKRIEQEMNAQLLTATERTKYVIKFNMDTLLRGDFKTRMEGLEIMFRNGWINTNEVRGLENMNPVDGGEVRYIQSNNMSPLDSEGKTNDNN